MTKVLLTLVSIFSMNAIAAGFACNEDMRAFDGTYKEIRLFDAGNQSHDLVFKSIGALEPTVTEKKLATGLKCHFAKDTRISYCFKKDDSAEGKNSLLLAKKVDVTQLGALEAASGNPSRQTFLEIDVRSPLMTDGKGDYRFAFSHCKAEL
jgi:hypothetical protein